MGAKKSKSSPKVNEFLRKIQDEHKAAEERRKAENQKFAKAYCERLMNQLLLNTIRVEEERIIYGHKCSQALNTLNNYKVDPSIPQETKMKLMRAKGLARECLSDQRAKEYMKRAKKNIKYGEYEIAKDNLEYALSLARYRNTKKLIEIERDKAYRLADRSKRENTANYLRDRICNGLYTAVNHRIGGDYEKALTVYDGLITDIRKYNCPTLIKEIIPEQRRCLNEYVIYLRDKGDALVIDRKFEDANRCFNEALKVVTTNPLITGEYYINIINTSKNSCANAQAKYLQTEALGLAKEGKLEQAIQKIDQALKLASLANELSTIQSLELDKFKYSIRNKDMTEAKRLQKVGNDKVKTNEFKEAIRAFEDALDYAHEESLIQSISTDRINAINKHAKFMQDEANKLVSQNKYEQAYVQFDNALEKARDLALYESIKKDKSDAFNKQIKFLQQLANKQASENKFDEAQKNFEKALTVPGDMSLIKSVKVDKAKAYNLQGLLCLKQGFDLDSKEPYTEQQAKEAREKFNFAKDLFQKADETNHTKEYGQNIQATIYKIYGDDKFNKAFPLEDDAYAIYKEAKKTKNEEKYISARKKYQEALAAFTEAKWSYEEGLNGLNRKEFKDSVKVASEQVNIISTIVKGTDTVRMWCAFQNKEHLYAEMVKNEMVENASSS